MVISAKPTKTPVKAINPSVLFQEIGGNRQLFWALVKTARQDLPRHLEQLQNAAQESDYPKVGHWAHKMKTTLAHWDAVSAHDLAESIEREVRANKPAKAVALIPRFVEAIRAVLTALENVEGQV
jgi:HPt (histidine-containing phosphotransfer) domain-containing protein